VVRCTESLLSLAALATLLATGCATPRLFEAGRTTEAPLRYQAAWTDGERLWLVYEAETTNARGRTLERRNRTVRLELRSLEPARGHPIDAFPLEHVEASRLPQETLQPVALRTAEAPFRGEPGLLLRVADGRHDAFSPRGFQAIGPDATFHSGALVERGTAPWVYPLLPFTLAYDTVAACVLTPLALPFFVAGE
jgi:hypothetical protein